MDMSIVLFPENLRQKLGEEASKELVEIINQSSQGTKKNTLEFVAERIERRLAEQKSEIIKWMFLFWAGQLAAIYAMPEVDKIAVLGT